MEEKIYKNRMLILLNVVMMTFMATLDSSIVNVALPMMAEKLSVSTEAIAWVVTAYLIVIATTILIFGKLGDIIGKIRVFKYGIAIFTIGSLMCGLANSFTVLVMARIIQAVGAAGAMATNQGIITQVFPRNERGRALGMAGTSVALGSLVGPPLGGFIVSVLSWKYIFLINIPIGIFALIMGARVLPAIEKFTKEKFDIKGALLIIIVILTLFGSLIRGEDLGYTKPIIITGLVIAALSMIMFIKIEKRMSEPLLQLEIFKNMLFSLSLLCAFISFVAISCSNIIQPFYLQNVMNLSPAVTGLILMAFPMILAIVAPISGYLSDIIGSEILTFLGLTLTSVGLFLMSTLNQHSSILTLVTFVIIMSIGNGLFQSPNTSLIMSTVTTNRLGIAGSVNALVRNLGMVFGISMATTLLYNRMSHKLGYDVNDYIPGQEDAFIYGMKVVFITAGVLCIIGALLTAYRLYAKRAKVKRSVRDTQ
ncbi:MAG: MFS transporter [Firmicutes bacterium HGW-Firmicutes-12]|jgi:EmrB/QacA subfamily drug resistance transporter|nr:MAG: MFS transporter [Firmicutes bacterium HGW-Firmicutes-12]